MTCTMRFAQEHGSEKSGPEDHDRCAPALELHECRRQLQQVCAVKGNMGNCECVCVVLGARTRVGHCRDFLPFVQCQADLDSQRSVHQSQLMSLQGMHGDGTTVRLNTHGIGNIETNQTPS